MKDCTNQVKLYIGSVINACTEYAWTDGKRYGAKESIIIFEIGMTPTTTVEAGYPLVRQCFCEIMQHPEICDLENGAFQ